MQVTFESRELSVQLKMWLWRIFRKLAERATLEGRVRESKQP